MRKTLLIIICLALIFCVASCGARESAEDILYSICAEAELPSGVTYLRGAAEGSAGYLDAGVIESLYGEDGEAAFLLLEDYAIYLSSFAVPYEVAVLECYSASDTERVAELCLERIDVLKVILRDTEYFDVMQRASVKIKGRTVVMKIV